MAVVLPARLAPANEAAGKESGAGAYCAGCFAGTFPANFGIRPRSRTGDGQRYGHPHRGQPQYPERAFPQAGGKQAINYAG